MFVQGYLREHCLEDTPPDHGKQISPSPFGDKWCRPNKLRRIRVKLANAFGSAHECFIKLDDDGGGSIDRKEMVLGLFALGVWLHPSESQALMVCQLCLFCMPVRVALRVQHFSTTCIGFASVSASACGQLILHGTLVNHSSSLDKRGNDRQRMQRQQDALDEDGGGEIEEDELNSYWEAYVFDGWK